jgi:hypothetical protein
MQLFYLTREVIAKELFCLSAEKISWQPQIARYMRGGNTCDRLAGNRGGVPISIRKWKTRFNI